MCSVDCELMAADEAPAHNFSVQATAARNPNNMMTYFTWRLPQFCTYTSVPVLCFKAVSPVELETKVREVSQSPPSCVL